MYIELCGTPGCGKSYLLEKLDTILINCNYKVMNLSHEKKKDTNKPFFKKKFTGAIHRIYILFSKSIKKERDAIQEYIKINPIKNESKVFYYILLNEMRKAKIADQLTYDMILCEEGIVQSITSLSHSKNMQDDAHKMIDVINSEFYNSVPSIIFYCYVDQTLNIERLKNRNKIGDRFLFQDETNIKNALSIKNNNILYVLNRLTKVKVIPINISDSDKALSFIIKQLEELGYAFDAKDI